MAQLHNLPFAGDNELFSIYGWRDLNGDGRMDNKHGGWDIRPPKVGGVVPTKTGEAPCVGYVDWRQVFNKTTSANDSTSYGNCVRLKAEGAIYAYMAHLYTIALAFGQGVAQGQAVGQYGPRTTGNSGGVHCHLEYRVGGTATARRVCPGELLGISNTKDVTYNREKIDAAKVGLLTCTEDAYRWRLGAGTDKALFKDSNNGAGATCHADAIYRVYATETTGGQLWCQITPPASCITKGSAPACWVSAACGSYVATTPAVQEVPADESLSDETSAKDTGWQRPTIRPEDEDGYLAIARLLHTLDLPIQTACTNGDGMLLQDAAKSMGAGYTSDYIKGC